MARKRRQDPEPDEEEEEDNEVNVLPEDDDEDNDVSDDNGEEDNDEILSSEEDDGDDDGAPAELTPLPVILASSIKSDGRYQNKQRLLVLSSRGVTARYRHLLEDLRTLLPHSKKECKLDVGKISTCVCVCCLWCVHVRLYMTSFFDA